MGENATVGQVKIRSVQYLGRDGWVQLSKVGGAEGSRWSMPVVMECRSYSVTLDELLESRRARGEVIKQQSDEIARLRSMLRRHHLFRLGLDKEDLALSDGKGGWLPVAPSDDYRGSEMYNSTMKALGRSVFVPEEPGDG